MLYKTVREGTFICRPNRFTAHVLIDGSPETVHVKNTGRCREILQEGARVLLEEASNPERKTRYSLISAWKGDVLINIDSQAPNEAVFRALKECRLPSFGDLPVIRRERFFGASRFDLYFEAPGRKGFIEVKGVTLERDGTALFPDAPTVRGTRHVYEMARAVEEGYEGYILFLIQMKGVTCFTPNRVMDPAFSDSLTEARSRGVRILAFDCAVTENNLVPDREIPVIL